MKTTRASSWVLALGFAASATAGPAYEPAGDGTRILDIGEGVFIRMLVEATNLGGGEVEVGQRSKGSESFESLVLETDGEVSRIFTRSTARVVTKIT